MSYSAVDII